MSGAQFLKLLSHKGIPSSCFACKARCHLDAVRRLRQADTISGYYIRVLLKEYCHLLTGEEIKLLKRS
ncbi:hypothetical protein [Aestuariibacter salexigens]|uniref:hypothetical protein n=1 Tax=Aestuariibacter salexigens TaxID=226010 RepID=UPI00040EF48F|nr:hypothetical protein [Aestuariibacter salexigens]